MDFSRVYKGYSTPMLLPQEAQNVAALEQQIVGGGGRVAQKGVDCTWVSHLYIPM